MLARDGETVGRPVSGRAAVDGPQLQAADLAEPAPAEDGAEDRVVAVHPPVGSAPDRVSPGPPLSALTHENQGPAIRDAEVTTFPSDRLGDGVKAIRWVRLEDGSIMRATNWVWRTAGRDIVVIAASGDLPLSEALDPLIDELARTISIAQ